MKEITLQLSAQELRDKLNIKNGENYVLTEIDKLDIASKIEIPIVEKLLQPIVTNEIKEVAITENREQIVNKINSGSDTDIKIEAKQITGLPNFTREVIREVGSGFVETPIKDSTGQPISKDSLGAWILPASSGGGTPGGSNTQIQFNNSGSFGGSASLTWNGTTLSTSSLTDTGLTNHRITFAGTGGLLSDSANFTYTTGTFDIFAFVGVQTINRNNIITTSTSALGLRNATVSTNSVRNQWSPRLGFTSHVWDSTTDVVPFWAIEAQTVNSNTFSAGAKLVFGYTTSTTPQEVVSFDGSNSLSSFAGGVTTLGDIHAGQQLVFDTARSVTPSAYSISANVNSTVLTGTELQFNGGPTGFKFRNYADAYTIATLDNAGGLFLLGQIQFVQGYTYTGTETYVISKGISTNDLVFSAGNAFGYRWLTYAGTEYFPAMTLSTYGDLTVTQAVYCYGLTSYSTIYASGLSSLNGGLDVNSLFAVDTSGVVNFGNAVDGSTPNFNSPVFDDTAIWGLDDSYSYPKRLMGTPTIWLPEEYQGVRYYIGLYQVYQP